MTLPRTEPSPHRRHSAPARGLGGADGNERLTALTGTALLLLFAAEGVTLLQLGRLLYWHYVIGFLLIGPVCLKIASTVYRFTRYYLRHEQYVRKGPPHPILRIIGPFVVLSTIAVLGTGVLLAVDHTSKIYFGFSLVMLHKLSFLGWAALMTIHVRAYVTRLPGLLAADAAPGRAARAVGGRGLRYSLLVLALGAGVILAVWGGHLSSTWHR
jgi:hypothetical protein